MVLPVTAPPISDGAVLVSGNRIEEVGPWRELGRAAGQPALDLGEVVLLPGLVNAHCHLDYTNMAGQLPPPKVFTDWLKTIVETKSGWHAADYAESWLNGAQMLLSTGTTTVGDVEAVPELLPEMWEATALRVLSFFEMIGITGRRSAATILQEALDRIALLPSTKGRVGISPHAPYSTLPELLRISARAARKRRWRVVTHVAESSLEYEMFAHGRGEMYDWMERSKRDMSDCGGCSPVEHLEACGLLGQNLLAIHANYLSEKDAQLLGKRKVSVVHCPRSHFYFRHASFPLRQLRDARVNICLGTDSLASVYKTRHQKVELNMFDEMRALAERETALSPKEILEMATVNGARALGLKGRAGALAPKAFADLVTIPWSGKAADAWSGVVFHQGRIGASMINGRWAIAPSELAV